MEISDEDDVTFLSGEEEHHKRVSYGVAVRQLRCRCTRTKVAATGGIVFTFLVCITLLSIFYQPRIDQKPGISNQQKENVGDWNSTRLSTDVRPDSYVLYMHPNLTTFTFSGWVNITVSVTSNTNNIVLHAQNLNISQEKITLTTKDGKKRLGVIKTDSDPDEKEYFIQFSEALNAKQQYVLHMEFSGLLRDTMYGLYNSSYKNDKGETRYLATTQFEAAHARAAFPCFDEPSFKAKFSLSMVRDPRMHNVSLFNMPKKSSETLANGLVVDHFEESVKMSSYLVAFIVCDFAKITANSTGGTQVSVYAPPHLISQAEYALDVASKVLSYYEEFFGVAFPLPKQDLVAIPDFSAGAMENWGLITYRMTAILYEEGVSDSSDKEWVAVVIAHELAHQWFGNLVTMKWWNDLWLNEGFATFVEYLGSDHYNSRWHMFDQFFLKDARIALGRDALSSSHPISAKVTSAEQTEEMFDTVTYSKGASIIRMLDSFIGRDRLRKGLTAYLKKYQYGNAETSDLWHELTEVSHPVDVEAVMNTWTNQKGYPVVHVTRKGNQLILSQERFLLYPKAKAKKKESPYNYIWQIPITISFQGQISKKLLTKEEDTVVLPLLTRPGWLKLNHEQTGFYRVNYDEEGWSQLTRILLQNYTALPTADRAGLLEDAFNLARANLVNITTALEMTQYLRGENEFVPWGVTLSNMLYLYDMLWGNEQAFNLYKKYMLSLMDPQIKRLGWERQPNEGHLANLMRLKILSLAVELGHNETVSRAMKMFNDWMLRDKPIRADYRSIVYKAGVSKGGEREWDFCWKKYLAESNDAEKKKLLIAMTFTKNIDKLSRYLQYALDPTKIKKQSAIQVLAGMSRNHAATALVLAYVKQNWDIIYERYGEGSFEIGRLIEKTTQTLHTQRDYVQLKNFFKANAEKLGTGEVASKQALESIKANIFWIKNCQDATVTWLQKKLS
ncbi:glutamyl aminopeptidase isoform X2 [Lingula anatina]|uniref:Aminopeptidase n=1 Tax=Lingula anatina TaxID=7574 RepID=A0A1S3HPY4_LINAN|nr:glutamyl aminopeptidase isoform X2 [Lingula anatina]|eukprot:XP_013387099.1 glutamyl aminopeptidase isoform X2 [Lingula anatina]